MKKIDDARIGSGIPAFWMGGIAVCIGIFFGLAGSGSADPSVSAVGTAVLWLGCALIGLGFWIGLFHKIELRLIDIQKHLFEQAERQVAPTSEATVADGQGQSPTPSA